jgi:hypothetical protein
MIAIIELHDQFEQQKVSLAQRSTLIIEQYNSQNFNYSHPLIIHSNMLQQPKASKHRPELNTHRFSSKMVIAFQLPPSTALCPICRTQNSLRFLSKLFYFRKLLLVAAHDANKDPNQQC